MKRTRHQFAPAMPGQKVIDRAVAGPVPDGLLIGRLEIVDVQHLSGPSGLGKARQQGLLLGHRHVLALASAARLGLERLDPTVVIGHVRPVHRAQRDTHGRCNRRLRHPALAQQYHLDALTLHGGNFPAQRCLQLPDLGLATFDHLFPLRIRWSERITPCSSKTIPFSRIRNQHKNRRFNQLWKRYKRSLEDHTAAMEKLMTARSPEKAMEVQTEYVKSVYEAFVTQTTKIGQLYTDLGKECYNPFVGIGKKTS